MQYSTPVALYAVVADDDPQDHQLIKNAFHDCFQNHIVTSVYNGRQLLDLLNQRGFYRLESNRLPDLVILDLRMPIMGGLEALEQIKTSPGLKDIRIYVLSEMHVPEHVQRALDLGAEGYFKKPLVYTELQELVTEVCRSVTDKIRQS